MNRLGAAALSATCLLLALSLAPELHAGDDTPDFATLAQSVSDQVVQDRRHLHANPELSLREFETQEWLRTQLAAIPGVEFIDGEWGTGLVARLEGGRPGPLVGYRADMDALPITEATGLPYASTRKDSTSRGEVGVMHACGHDIHMAVFLNTIRVLSGVRDRMPGTLLLIAEPGEEIGAGSYQLLEAGVFDNAKPDAIYAIHDHPSILAGQVSYCPGQSQANVDGFRVTIKGRGGHGAYPHKSIDPITIASRMVLAFQSIVGREINPTGAAVITVGSFHGGTKSNVIPDEAVLEGTVRSHTDEIRQQLYEAILRTANGISEAAGAPEPEIEYGFGTPALKNDLELVEETLPVLRAIVGDENTIQYTPTMGGEDFSRFAAEVPGFLFRLGVGRPDREMALHNAEFDPDESALPLGVRIMCEVIWSYMERHSEG